MNDSEGHGVAVELCIVGGDGGEDHADGADDGDGDEEDSGKPAGEDRAESEDECPEEERDLEIDGFSTVIIEERGFVFFDLPHDNNSDERDHAADTGDVEQEGQVHEHSECSFIGGGVWVEGFALGVDRWRGVGLLLVEVVLAHDPLFHWFVLKGWCTGVLGECGAGFHEKTGFEPGW